MTAWNSCPSRTINNLLGFIFIVNFPLNGILILPYFLQTVIMPFLMWHHLYLKNACDEKFTGCQTIRHTSQSSIPTTTQFTFHSITENHLHMYCAKNFALSFPFYSMIKTISINFPKIYFVEKNAKKRYRCHENPLYNFKLRLWIASI